MPFAVVQPPKDEAKFAEVGKELHAALKGYGLNVDAEGFLLAWVNGTRVVVERENTPDGRIVGIALVTIGKRWTYGDFTASLLFIQGRDELFDFVKQISTALGATVLFVESRELSSTPEKTTYEVVKYHLS